MKATRQQRQQRQQRLRQQRQRQLHQRRVLKRQLCGRADGETEQPRATTKRRTNNPAATQQQRSNSVSNSAASFVRWSSQRLLLRRKPTWTISVAHGVGPERESNVGEQSGQGDCKFKYTAVVARAQLHLVVLKTNWSVAKFRRRLYFFAISFHGCCA